MDQHIVSVSFRIEHGTFSRDGSRYVINLQQEVQFLP